MADDLNLGGAASSDDEIDFRPHAPMRGTAGDEIDFQPTEHAKTPPVTFEGLYKTPQYGPSLSERAHLGESSPDVCAFAPKFVDTTQFPVDPFSHRYITGPPIATEEETKRAGTISAPPDVKLPGPHGTQVRLSQSDIDSMGRVFLPGLNPDATLQGNAPIINPERGLIAPQNLDVAAETIGEHPRGLPVMRRGEFANPRGAEEARNVRASQDVEQNIEQGLRGNRRDVAGEIREEHRTKLERGEITPGETTELSSGPNPKALIQGAKMLSRVWDERVARPLIDKVLKIGDKYQKAREADPAVAEGLHLLDNAPQYLRSKAAQEVHNVIGDLSRAQERLFTLMADADSRENLRVNHPQEYAQAQRDAAIQAALKKYKPLEQELTALREKMGGEPLTRTICAACTSSTSPA